MQDRKQDALSAAHARRHARTAYRGITEGAPVLTAMGMRAVEYLKAGDLVVTSAGMQRLVGTVQLARVTAAVYVLAGSQGHSCQARDSLLPAGQPILVRDWRARAFNGTAQALVPAGDLVDGEHLRDLGQVPLTFYQLSFAQPVILHADGLELPCATACPQPGRVNYTAS